MSAGRLQQANALMGISRNGGSILGPPISGLIVALAGPGAVFMVDAATFAVSAVSLLLLRPMGSSSPEDRQPFLTELAGGWREVVGRPWITAALVAFGISNASGAAFFILGPVIADAQLHGGANTNVMKMLLEIGSVDRVESYIKNALAKKKKIMGFGHPVYRTDDPRATHLRRFSKEMGERKGDTKWYEMTVKVEEVMKGEKGLLPNVDCYSASTYYMMGIPLDLYTSIFAISRISGWTAHILEQYADNKLIRPRAEYIGPRNVPYVPIDER